MNSDKLKGDKLMQELLSTDKIQALLNAEDFYFDRARSLFLEFKSVQIDNELLSDISKGYNGKTKYVDYCEQLSNDRQKQVAVLIGKLTAYCDDKAANKKEWNQYPDKRVIARAGVWQTHWIKNFVEYKLNNCNSDTVSSDSIKHAIKYLEDPDSGLCMLSIGHRNDLSLFLFGEAYDEIKEKEFIVKLKGYFEQFSILPKNSENLTRVITDVFYSEEMRPLWMLEKDETKLKYIAIIKSYKEYIQSSEYNEFFKWNAVLHYRKTINFDAPSFADNFKEAIKKNDRLIYQNLVTYMKTLGQYFPDFQKEVILDLLNEDGNIDVKDRITEFIEKTKSKLQDVKDALDNQNLSNTQDEGAVSAYLTFQYPEKYSFYKARMYDALCKFLGRRSKKAGKKLEHFWRLLEPLKKLIKNDDELLEIFQTVHKQEYEWDQTSMIAQDIVYCYLKFIHKDIPEELEQTIELVTSQTKKMHLNTILYGPPGTGKTYNSIIYAVAIIEDKSLEEIEQDDYHKVKNRYNQYKDNGRIEFTTFHQSMSYEDFIEGIKPVMKNEDDRSDSGNVEYEIRNGLFKEMVDNANTGQDFAVSQKVIKIDPEKFELPVNKISLGNSQVSEDQVIYDYCMDNDCIALGFGDDIDFSGVSSKQEIRKRFKDAGMEFTNRPDFPVSAMERFNLLMKKGQLVFIPKGLSKLSAIGVVAGDYFFDDSESGIRYKHFRKVNWLYKDLDIPIKEIYSKKFSQQTIYQMSGKEMNVDFFQGKGQNTHLSNYVLIIDEINRGNIAQIFGELITLLEPNKRAGQKEALETILPYSQEKFSVPSNLYVVGTMNTADRSVEALDTALRRRFSFVEMPPKPEIIAEMGNYVGKVDIVKMLNAINSRIERLLDKDHCIGHSYFLEIKNDDDLRDTFRDKVIPLLEEYFFGDLAKIGMVLGDSFVEESNTSHTYALKSFTGSDDGYADDMNEKKVFRIKSPNEWNFSSVYE